MSIWYIAGPFLALAVVAIVAALSSGIPEAQRDDDLYLDPDQLDAQIAEALADWGKGGVA